MKIWISFIFHWNYKCVCVRERIQKEKVTVKEWNESCDNSDDRWASAIIPPCWSATAAEWRVCTATDAPLQISVHDQCYCAVLRDPPCDPDCPLKPHRATSFNGTAVKCFIYLLCQMRVVLLTKGYSFFWCNVTSVNKSGYHMHS